jgi:hypothetical protein
VTTAAIANTGLVAACWVPEAGGFATLRGPVETDLAGSGAFCICTVAWGKGCLPAAGGIGTRAVSFFGSAFSGAGATGAVPAGPFGAGGAAGAEEAGLRGAGGAEGGAPGGLGGATGGFGAPEAEGGIGGLGGAEESPGGLGGAEGGTPGAAGAGFGGRFTMAFSRGLAPLGWPSRRGGRTMRTVSFLGWDINSRRVAKTLPENRGRCQSAAGQLHEKSREAVRVPLSIFPLP